MSTTASTATRAELNAKNWLIGKRAEERNRITPMAARIAVPVARPASTRAQASITFADKNTVKADLVAK